MVYDSLPLDKVIDVMEWIEHRVRAACMDAGGSISHHHGVGKKRKRFMARTVSDLHSKMLKGVKEEIDPKNIFGINNIHYT